MKTLINVQYNITILYIIPCETLILLCCILINNDEHVLLYEIKITEFFSSSKVELNKRPMYMLVHGDHNTV